jgi:hypothetical protein
LAIGLAILAPITAVLFLLERPNFGLILLAFAIPLCAIFDLISLHNRYRRRWESVDIFWLLGMIFFALLVVPVWFVAGRWIRARELARTDARSDQYQR